MCDGCNGGFGDMSHPFNMRRMAMHGMIHGQSEIGQIEKMAFELICHNPSMKPTTAIQKGKAIVKAFTKARDDIEKTAEKEKLAAKKKQVAKNKKERKEGLKILDSYVQELLVDKEIIPILVRFHDTLKKLSRSRSEKVIEKTKTKLDELERQLHNVQKDKIGKLGKRYYAMPWFKFDMDCNLTLDFRHTNYSAKAKFGKGVINLEHDWRVKSCGDSAWLNRLRQEGE